MVKTVIIWKVDFFFVLETRNQKPEILMSASSVPPKVFKEQFLPYLSSVAPGLLHLCLSNYNICLHSQMTLYCAIVSVDH